MKPIYFVAGAVAFLLLVQDSNAQWVAQNSGTSKNLRDVAMLDSLHAVCVGEGESILHTSDGGTTWQTVHTGTSTLYSVSFISKMRGVAGGDSTVLFTDDGGVTWTKSDSGITTSIYRVSCVDTSSMVAVGSHGYFDIYLSTDAGVSWVLKYTYSTGGANSPYGGFSGLAFDGRFGVACGGSNNSSYYPQKWVSTYDGGRTWNDMPFNYDGIGTLKFVSIPDTSSIFLAVDSPTWQLQPQFAMSTDEGNTWSVEYTLDVSQSFTSLYFLNALKGFVAFTPDSLIGTEDGGKTWHAVDLGRVGQINGISFSDPRNGMLVEDGGLIMRTRNGGITGIKQQSGARVPGNIQLYCCYPNPFNPSTTITYQIARESYVSLNVYNSLGQLVKKLVSETQQSGRYHVLFDGSYFPSGVYFCKLICDGTASTTKMVLVK